MEATFYEGIRSSNPIIKAIAVKALHYRDMATMGDVENVNARKRAQTKYDVLVELWNELSDEKSEIHVQNYGTQLKGQW